MNAENQMKEWKHEQIENEVRAGLEGIEKKEMLNYFEKHPELEQKMEALRKGFDESIRGAFREVLPKIEPNVLNDEKSMNEAVEYAMKEFAPLLEPFGKMFSTKNFYDAAGDEYKHKASQTQLELLETQMAASELGDAGKKLVSGFKPLMEYIKVNDIFVEKLVETAEEKGVDYALKEETINATRKWAFPTLQDYQKHKETGTSVAMKALDGMYAMFDSLGDTADEKMMFSLVRTVLEKSIGSYMKLAVEVGNEISEQRMRKTYGDTKASGASNIETERAKVLERYASANN